MSIIKREFDVIAMKRGKSTLINSLAKDKKFTLVVNLTSCNPLCCIPDLTYVNYEMNQESLERMIGDLKEVNLSMRFNKYIFYTNWTLSKEVDSGLIDDILDALGSRHCVFMVKELD